MTYIYTDKAIELSIAVLTELKNFPLEMRDTAVELLFKEAKKR